MAYATTDWAIGSATARSPAPPTQAKL